jgi:transcription initiation factor TFIIH subunit 3
MLYSSTNPVTDNVPQADANSYPAFKVVDSAVVQRIMDELDALGDPDEEGLS